MIGWTAIVPVKAWALAKSRLKVPADVRFELARAFTLDLFDVLSQTSEIEATVVVSTEPELLLPARRISATVIDDTSRRSSDPLNAAVMQGQSWAATRHPEAPLVVIPTDLPCLTAKELSSALQHLSQWTRAFVPDLAGHGTTLVGARTPEEFLSAYGPLSAARHARFGVRCVHGVADGVRRDVDTLRCLLSAWRAGVQPHTLSVMSRVLTIDPDPKPE